MKKIAVILAGCGNKDGSEITEAVSTLVALANEGAEAVCFSLNKDVETVNFLTGASSGSRNLLAESARISRSEITDIIELKSDDFDALIIPGGYGAALHLCDWAKNGVQGKVEPEVARVITEFHKQVKPIGAICIAPVLLAKVLGKEEITITLGRDNDASVEIAKTGAHHEDCAVDDYVTDRSHKIVTTPAYMYNEAKPNQVFAGISGLVKEVVEMA